MNIGMLENLQIALEYKRWDKFCKVIENAKITCEKSKYAVSNHFSQVGKMINLGKGGKRKVIEYKLSRYACYLIVMDGNPSLSLPEFMLKLKYLLSAIKRHFF